MQQYLVETVEGKRVYLYGALAMSCFTTDGNPLPGGQVRVTDQFGTTAYTSEALEPVELDFVYLKTAKSRVEINDGHAQVRLNDGRKMAGAMELVTLEYTPEGPKALVRKPGQEPGLTSPVLRAQVGSKVVAWAVVMVSAWNASCGHCGRNVDALDGPKQRPAACPGCGRVFCGATCTQYRAGEPAWDVTELYPSLPAVSYGLQRWLDGAFR